MFSLALETSGRVGSVALVRNGAVVDERTYPHGLKHATALVPLIDAMCRDGGIGPADLAELYVSIGPGSFTGLRVGVTLAKTLAFATGARIVAVPSLSVLVENVAAVDGQHAIVALDAKRGQVFCGSFRALAGAWTPVEPPGLRRLDALLAATPRPLTLTGELTADDRALVASDAGVSPLLDTPARASVVARLGKQLAAQGQFTDPFALAPFYVRLAEAEEKRLIAEGKLPAVV